MPNLIKPGFLGLALAVAAFGGPALAQQAAPVGPSGPEQDIQNAIPLTPSEIQNLANRYNMNQQAMEQGMTPLAAPLSRQVDVDFAPGAAVSIISTMKGYPTAVSFFDSTGQPGPIAWDTNSNPAAA